MTSGKVKWFSSERGYGFIYCPNDKADYYFGVRNVVGGELPIGGEDVTFTPRSTDRGLSATEVRILSGHSANTQPSKVNCRSCGMAMTPRLVAHNGSVLSTVCPFCLSVHFKKPLSATEKLAYAVVGLGGFALAVVLMLSLLARSPLPFM